MSDQQSQDHSPAVGYLTPQLRDWVRWLTSWLESPAKEDSGWCDKWEEHPEAVLRFAALRDAFTEAAADGAMSSWWVGHFDRHAPYLFGKTGIFQECRHGEHEPDRPFRFAPRS